jgi:uncharacterized membrane protein
VRRALTIFNGFVHDFAAGTWAATVFAVWWVRSAAAFPQAEAVLRGLMQQFFWLGAACVILVMATGAGRTFTYAWVGDVYGPEAERLRRRLLIAKHVVLLLVFGAGTAWQYALAFR